MGTELRYIKVEPSVIKAEVGSKLADFARKLYTALYL